MASSSSSSSSITRQAKYDVFLSFRGEDTRDSFTSHLYAALCRKQVKTFIDFDGLKRGDEISSVLLKAIENSKVSVIIFSEDYASSRWCLEELAKIIECKEMNGQVVVPVFYHLNALDVQKQSGSYKKAFVEHEERFKGMAGKVLKWRAALTEAAKISGWDSSLIKPESKLVEEIVEGILKKLKYISPSSNCEGLIGMESRIEKIKSLLCIGSSDFKVVGIWGMGGIGKTTIAGAVFSEMSSQFEGYCFCINVREESEKRGLVNLRNHILSQILEEKNPKSGTPRIPQYTRERLHRKKVLIVLDDVNDFEQLEILAGGLDRFGPGSRIIITTRNKQVLCSYGVDDIYEVERFNYNEALQLFCTYAFKQNHPPKGLVEISNRVLGYAKGNPLALKVLGASLHLKSKQDWESVLHKFKMISNPKIHDVLRVSFHGLDREEKEIFLDIACFFKGEDKDEVVKILDGCYLLDFGLSSLIDKSLITIFNNKLQMHDLLQELGQEIVCQESTKEPGKRSRLWYHEDVYHVLKNNKGTDSIEGIFLNMSKIRDVRLTSKAFANMCNLRLIKFYNPGLYEENVEISKVHLLRGLKYLPDKLRYFYWAGCPMKALPSKFCLQNLVELKLPCSNVEQLWKGTKYAFKLKSIDLHKSENLIEIPDLSEAPQLEIINLEECRSLAKVPTSIQYLNNLSLLCLRGCERLQSFPSNIHFGSHITLDLSYCINLTKFPQVSGNIIVLCLNGTAIEEVPSSISCLTQLVLLDMANCTALKSISTSICKLKSLYRLYLWNCSKLESFPEILEKMERLEDLNLNGTAIKELPSSIEHLNVLRNLELHDCKDLENIPSSLSNLASLCEIDLSGCSKLDKLPENLGNLIYLKRLNAKGAAVSHLPSSIAGLKEISDLDLSFCTLMEIPKDICGASSLVVLDLSGNNFASLPTSIKLLSQLKFLHINNCNMLQSLPELPLSLEYLEAMNCKLLQSLPELPSSLKGLDPSEIEIIFESCSADALNNNDFIFTNCQNLNQKAYIDILADSRQRIQCLATASLRLCYEKVIDETPAISFCLPGSEIPYWFSYQNSASSINIKLPQHWCNRRFIGFALCAVVAFDEGSYYDEAIYVRCDYQFEGSNVDRVQFGCNFMVSASLPDTMAIESDHMVLGYSPFMDIKLFNGDYTTASFEFSPIKNFPIRTVQGCKVKFCGVCPLYAQPEVSEPNISIENLSSLRQDFGETIAEGYIYKHADTIRNESGRSDEEETEPKPKRIRRNEISSKEL